MGILTNALPLILAYPFTPGRMIFHSAGITVVGIFSGNSSTASFDITLTGTASGDVCYVNQCGAATATYPSGYTGLTTVQLGGTTRYFNTSRKVFSAADSSVTIPASQSSYDGNAAIAIVLRGVNATPEDATTTTASNTTGQPDNASITTVTNNALVIAAFGAFVNADGTYTAPSGYSNNTGTYGDGTLDIGVGLATLVKTSAGAENPGAWSGVTFNAGTPYWGASTVAVRPA